MLDGVGPQRPASIMLVEGRYNTAMQDTSVGLLPSYGKHLIYPMFLLGCVFDRTPAIIAPETGFGRSIFRLPSDAAIRCVLRASKDLN